VSFGPHRQLLEAIERSIQRDIARNGEILQGGSKALQDLIKDRFEASDGAQDEDLAIEKVGNAEEDCNSPGKGKGNFDDVADSFDDLGSGQGRQRRNRGRFESGEDALDQLSDIESAQKSVRGGKLKRQIDSIRKSKDRAQHKLNRTKSVKDAMEEFGDEELF
jgi:hypothetical protein